MSKNSRPGIDGSLRGFRPEHLASGPEGTAIDARRINQLRANVTALEASLTDAQIATLIEVTKPVLNFPARNSSELASSLAFAGATVDGRATKAIVVNADGVRY